MLQKDCCPPLDSSLFYAIVSDYDTTNEASLADLRTILEALKESATLEETAQFDPSGSTGPQDGGESQSSSERAKSWHADFASTSEYTEETDLSELSRALDMAHMGNEVSKGGEYMIGDMDYEKLCAEDKSHELIMMFPSVRKYDIVYTLQKAGNSFNRALEELLNVASLEEEGEQSGKNLLPRGAEGFSAPAVAKRGRKRKGKKTQLHRRASSTPAPLEEKTVNSSPSPSSRWDHAKEQINFVATRTHVPPATITSLYHKNGASLPATIATICQSSNISNPYLSYASPSILTPQAAELAIDFPSLRPQQASALVRLTYPSTASAHELARSLVSSGPASQDSQIVPQYLPRPPSPISASSSPLIPSTRNLPVGATSALAATRSTAFSQASSAYRLSKSKPLMAGAAAFYSSVGRDASAALRQRETAEADALVTAQSRIGEVDLHGVSVKESVRIARERVEMWWEKEGREWAREGKVRSGGLRVITGKGQHSEGGKGRLGPAVGAMLIKEGWKVEIGQGVIDVSGKVRR